MSRGQLPEVWGWLSTWAHHTQMYVAPEKPDTSPTAESKPHRPHDFSQAHQTFLSSQGCQIALNQPMSVCLIYDSATTASGNFTLSDSGPVILVVCSVTKPCLTLCDPMDCSTPASLSFTISESAQTHVRWMGDAIQPSHPLSLPSPPALSLSQHQGLFHWVGSSHQVAKVLVLQLQHQSFHWIFRVDLL